MSELSYRDLLGTPFRHGGRSRESGLDCYGLVMELYRRLGVELPEFQSLAEPAAIEGAVVSGSRMFQQLESPEPYCVVTLTVRPPYVSHVGLVLPDLYRFIHTMPRTSVCVERLDSPEWRHRVRGFFRWPR